MRKYVRDDEKRGRVRTVLPQRPFACILGTGPIASEIACTLVHGGWSVVLSHDPAAAVLRRKTAFYDVLFGENVSLNGVEGIYAAHAPDIRRVFSESPHAVAVTPLDLMNLLVLAPLDLLIDARAESGRRPDLRHLARVTMGIGPAWYGGVNCDFAIPMPQPCARQGMRVPAPAGGYWYSVAAPDQHIARHMILGKVGGVTVRAPCDGLVLGILRSGLRLPPGAPLADIGRTAEAAGPAGAGARQVAREVRTLIRSACPELEAGSTAQNFLRAMPCLRNA